MVLYWIGVAGFSAVTFCVLFLLGMAIYNLSLVLIYRKRRGPDPEPSDHFEEADLPVVTVQLPTYNEGKLVEQSLRLAADLDYPRDKLEIQLLDDSDDGITSGIAQTAIEDLKKSHPGISFTYMHRDDRSGFKAGALLQGTEKANGDFFAIFDADFVIPKDFLRRTIHFFKEPDVGAVQARWDYLNHDSWLFTRLQANKLDTHQMFEQTARARSGLAVIFHGTAGVWRATALRDADSWNCLSEVEDVELTVRAVIKGWRLVYLDHFRLQSELPENVLGFVRQQMRWKRGWTRVVVHYTGMILRADLPWRERLDLLQRIHLSWGPIFALVMTLGVLPYFIVADWLGISLPAALLYVFSLFISLLARHFETKTLREDPVGRPPMDVNPIFRFVPLSYLILSLGMLWPLAQATLEGFRPGQVWEVTPKTTTTPGSTGHFTSSRLPFYVVGTIILSLLGAFLTVLSVGMKFPLAALFYGMLSIGSGWVGLQLAADLRGRRLGRPDASGKEKRSSPAT